MVVKAVESLSLLSRCRCIKVCTHEVMVDRFVVDALNLGSVEGVSDVESRAVETPVFVFTEGVVAILRARAAPVSLQRQCESEEFIKET